MTDNLPAVPDPEPPRELARPATNDVDSWIEVMRPVVYLADRIAGTEFVPKSLRDSPAAVAAAILYGREVGLPPVTALTQTHVIEGKPAMSAEAMRAMVFAAGHDLVIEETTGARCRMKARRRGQEAWTTLEWSIDMARAAGVANKGVWKSYPRAMLQARCTTELVRLVFPDVIHGFRSVEELEDLGGEEAAAPAEAAPQSGTRVARKTTAKRTAARKEPAELPSAPVDRSRPPAPAGPPLPGEPGYDDVVPGKGPAAGASDDGEVSQPAAPAGQDSEDAPADAPEPEQQEQQPEEGDEPPPAANDGEGDGGPEGTVEEATAPRLATRGQIRMLMAMFKNFGVDDDRDEQLAIIGRIARPIDSRKELTSLDAKKLLDTLGRCGDREALYRLMDELDQAEAENARAQGEDES